ncbi:hypothetical protein SLEP1_g60387, partial [Rubroshorea leprosula]
FGGNASLYAPSPTFFRISKVTQPSLQAKFVRCLGR